MFWKSKDSKVGPVELTVNFLTSTSLPSRKPSTSMCSPSRQAAVKKAP